MLKFLAFLILMICRAAFAEAFDVPVEKLRGKRIRSYQVFIQDCDESRRGALRILRSFKVGADEFVFAVEKKDLRTFVALKTSIFCESLSTEKLIYDEWLENLKEQRDVSLNQGLRQFRNDSGSYLTIDFCPSHQNMDSNLKDWIMSQPGAVPLGLSMTAKWISNHKEDWDWIREQVVDEKIFPVWINHSLTHPYRPGLREQENFLLLENVNFDDEVLKNEEFLLREGILPSIYFRFPGLVSDRTHYQRILDLGLIPLGSQAWIAKSEVPKPGGLLLVHGNGNEPRGLEMLFRLFELGRVPLPLKALPFSASE